MSRPRIGLVGLGTIGQHIARLLLEHRTGYDLVGAVTLEESDHGRPLHEVVGADRPTAVVVSGELSTLLARHPDIVLHATRSFLRDVTDDLLACIAAGSNVISCAEELAYPARRDPSLADRLDRAAVEAGVTVVGTGVNPGFLFDSLLAKVTGICWDVTRMVGRRVVDVSGFGEAIHRRLGIGYSLEEFEEGHRNGTIAGHVGFPESIAIVFDSIGLELDGDVVETFEPLIAEEPAATSYGAITAGTTEGFIQRAVGRWRGADLIQLELVLHLRPEERGFQLQDSIDIDGVHPVHLTIAPGPSALMATSANIVNSIPSVLAAPAGVRTVTDLPPPAAWLGPLDVMTGRGGDSSG